MTSTQLNHIQVCCRIRGSEDGQAPTISTFLNNDNTDTRGARSYEVVTLNGSFQMDYAFDNGDSQECIFDRIVQPLLADAFAGFNCSLFSYGQTGSGKTYTLIGDTGSALGATTSQDNRERGIIPRAAEQIFARQASLDPTKIMCQVRMSILEVYQEQLKDLLRVSTVNGAGVSAKDTNGLRIREQIDGTVWVENLTELVVAEDGDFNRLLSGALKRRVVGAHSMNDVSSRSHFCCILNINQVFHATGVKINSKVHFIDLAGSEMVRKTDATGVRFTEAKHINKSLSALGNVIYALSGATKPADANNNTAAGAGAGTGVGASGLSASQQLGSSASLTSQQSAGGAVPGNGAAPAAAAARDAIRTHVPYRDSKLTRLLQNSLGGNAKTVIILTISDAKKHLAETLSTLRFGARARQIQTRAVVNRSILEDQAQMKKNYTKAVQENVKLQDLVAELQAELHHLRQHPSATGAGGDSSRYQAEISGREQDEEAVCEVCRNFLDLKLRGEGSNGGGGGGKQPASRAPPQQPQRDEVHSIYASSDAAPKPGSFNRTASGRYSGIASGTSGGPSGSVSGMDSVEDDYSLVEPMERCAICGLSGEEAEKLQLYTGEVLGEMFSCDGNCGHQFHVRCVGLVGDGGQYTLPEGEWFCTECYSAYDSGGDTLQARSLEGSVDGGTPVNADRSDPNNWGDGDGNSASAHSTDALYRSLSNTDVQIAAAESLKIAPNKNPSSVLATIKAEYHTMRKERNRILAQWQQEKRIIEKYEVSRRLEQQKRDQELVNAKDTIAQLENIVAQGEAQSARMQKLFDIMLKELQLSTSNMTNMNTSNSGNSAAIRNSVDRLKWASLTVESLLDMPIDKIQDDQDGAAESSERSQISQPGSFTRSPKGLQHSATSPNLSLSLDANGTGTGGVSLSGASTPSAGAGAGIPKPWKGKARISNTSTSAGEQGMGMPSPAGASVLSATAGSTTSSASSNSNPAARPIGAGVGKATASPRPVSHEVVRAFAPVDNQGLVRHGSSATLRMVGSSSTSSLPSRPERAPEKAESSPKNDRSQYETEIKRKHSDPSDSESEGGRSQLKFVNPLKNRLKDLLKSVEAETDAFAEIRQKFKSREDVRNQIRSSMTLEK